MALDFPDSLSYPSNELLVFSFRENGEQMKTILGGSTALILAVLISTGFLMGGCGGGGGSGSGSDTSNTPTKPIPPDINVSTTQIDFGGTVFNNFADRTVTIQNRGSSELNIGQIAWANRLDPPFSILNDTCSGRTLASLRRTCTLLVRF